MAYKPLDDRQVINRAILQELFPYAGSQTLDVLMASIDVDLTAPLKVDASNPADLTVHIGPAIVENSISHRSKSISFIDNILPVFTSGTVTFPSTNGGTITASPGSTSTLTLPPNNYAFALLSLDVTGNLIVSVGAPNPVFASAVVPPPMANTLAFAYITLFNNAGTVQQINQGAITQLVGGGGSGGGGGVSQEVALTIGTITKAVTFPTPLNGSNYIVLAQIVDTIDANPQFIPVTITNKTSTGFTASWNAPLPTTNYFLDYIVSPGVTQEQTGEAIIPISATSVTVTLPLPLSGTAYTVIGEFINVTDINPQFQPVTITNKTASSFTAKWNAPVNTANYRLAYQVAAFQ